MKNKKIVKILVVIVLLCLVWVGYKGLLLSYYNTNDEMSKELFKEVIEVAIEKNTTNQNESVSNMSYYIPSNYHLIKEENNQKTYTLNGTTEMANKIIIGEFNYESLDIIKSTVKFINYDKLFQKYNIQDEIDIYRYYYEHKDEKRNILWSKSHIQINAVANFYLQIIGGGDSSICQIQFLTKDLKGLMSVCFVKEANLNYFTTYITHNKKMYYVRYLGTDIMSYEEFMSIIKSISFN